MIAIGDHEQRQAGRLGESALARHDSRGWIEGESVRVFRGAELFILPSA